MPLVSKFLCWLNPRDVIVKKMCLLTRPQQVPQKKTRFWPDSRRSNRISHGYMKRTRSSSQNNIDLKNLNCLSHHYQEQGTRWQCVYHRSSNQHKMVCVLPCSATSFSMKSTCTVHSFQFTTLSLEFQESMVSKRFSLLTSKTRRCVLVDPELVYTLYSGLLSSRNRHS